MTARRLRFALIGLFALWAACDLGAPDGGGQGCVRVHQGQGYQFPLKRVLQGALSVVVTQDGVDFLTERIRDLVLAFFDADESGHAVVPLDTLGLGDLSTELGPLKGNVRDLVVTLDLASLSVELVPGTQPARLRISVQDAVVGLASGTVAGEVNALGFKGDLACGLGNGKLGHVAVLSFDLELALGTTDDGVLDVQVLSLTSDVKDVSLAVLTDCTLPECLDGLTPPAEGECGECKTACGAAGLAADLASILHDIFDQLIDDLVGWLADDLANLLLDLLLNGRPLAVEGRLDVAALASPLLPYLASASPLDVLGRPGAEAFQVLPDLGGAALQVTLDAGADSAPVHPCVAPVGAEPIFSPGPVPAFPELATGADGVPAPYHVGLATSAALVNEAVWAAYKSGALCIALTTDDLATLSGGRLVLTARLLDLLLPGAAHVAGPDAPVRVVVKPRLDAAAMPVVRFGDGQATPTLQVQLSQASVALDLLVADQWLRAIAFRADLALGLSIDALSDARLGLRLADVALTGLSLPDNEIFAAARMDLIAPFVVDLALGVLGQMPIQLDLATTGLAPELLGVPVEPVVRAITSAGPDDGWLHVLVALQDPAPPPAPLTPQAFRFREPTPGQLWFQVDAPAGHEVQLRVAGGSWSRWFPAQGEHRLTHPRLWLTGRLSLEARLRRAGGTPGPAIEAGQVDVHAPAPAEPSAPEPEAPEPEPEPQADAPAPHDGCSGGDAAPTTLWLVLVVWLVRRRSVRLVALALAFGACADEAVAPASVCSWHDQCPDGFLCGPEGRCVGADPCAADADCCPGATCFRGWCRPTDQCDAQRPCERLGTVCEAGQCAPAPCEADLDCPSPLRCAAGRCLGAPPCDGACPEGTACHLASGRCLPAPACAALCGPDQVPTVAEAPPVPALRCAAEHPCACATLPRVLPGFPGFEGRLLATPSQPVVVSYEPTYGDLVLSRLTVGDPDRDDLALDGVPDVPPLGDVTGYRAGVAAPGPDRGRRPAVAWATTPTGVLVDVLYRDEDEGALRYLRVRPADGKVVARSRVPIPGDAGRYSCLVREHGTGQLTGLAFVAADPTDSVARLVRLRATTDAPDDDGDWEVVTVLERPLPARDPAPCGDACGPLELCGRLPDGDRCVPAFDGLSCEQACPAHHLCHVPDEAGAAPTCVPRVHRTHAADRLPFGRGLFVSCAAGPAGVVAAWYDADHGLVESARAPFAGAPIAIVDGTAAAHDVPDLGHHVRVALREDGAAAVAYHDATHGRLWLAEQASAFAPWQATLVHEATGVDARALGAWPALVYDAGGQPTLAHADATRANVLLARRDAAGCWKQVEVLSSGGWIAPDLALAPDGQLFVSALRLGFTPALAPDHELRLLRVPPPTCGGD